MSLAEKVSEFIQKNNLITPGETILAAVSGGPDSTALSLILHSLQKKLKTTVVIFHLDHMVRKNSYKDTIFVEELAEKLGAQFLTYRYDVAAYAKQKKLSLQEAAREVRYNLLADAANKTGAAKIATGHQANDQIETFFLRLLRGAALTGLKSIPVKRDAIIRPLLNISRREILDYLQEQNQPYLTDPSNIKPVYLRNRVRSQLLPVLESLNPTYQSVLLNNINLINEEEQLLELLSTELAENLITQEGNFTVIEAASFDGLAASLKRRLIRRAILNVKGDLRAIESKHIGQITENYSKFGFSLELPGDLLFYRDYKVLRIGRKEYFRPVKLIEHHLKIGRSIELKPTGSVIEASLSKKCESSAFIACLDYAKIEPPLKVRSRQAGDRFQPLGNKGSKKLQDYFVDNKVPKFSRDSIAVIEDKEKIIWVSGFTIDERAKIDKSTKEILKLELR